MVESTPHDSATLSRLVQFVSLPAEKRQEIFDEIEAPEARTVGEGVLDPEKYSGASPAVQATVDRFNQWLQANRRVGRQRANGRRTGRLR